MSVQYIPNASAHTYRITAASSLPQRALAILGQLPSLGITGQVKLEIEDLYFVEGNLNLPDLACLAALICDPVTDHYEWRNLEDRVAALGDGREYTREYTQAIRQQGDQEKGDVGEDAQGVAIEVAWRPGVTDNAAHELMRAARQSGVNGLQAVATGQRYVFTGDLSQAELNQVARALLVNNTVQRYELGEIQPEFVHTASTSQPDTAPKPEIIPLDGLDDAGLLLISKERRLALDANEMRAIQAYFAQQGRAPSDAELETLAQTWSEHCGHKTFKALIQTSDGQEIDGLLRSTIMAASKAIHAPWVRSAFVDNAGVIEFDDELDLSFKVETHNHPSAIEPFGGSNTGVGGVVRDVLGVSHRPVAVTDVLCFGPADQPYDSLPEAVLHPRRIRSGVVAGVADYGNKLGLATINGAVLYHPGYTANPLVYCGCIGLGPRGSHAHQAQPGDRVIVIGGRTGRDGLRGATFSSLTMDAQTGQVAGASVQIGDPITEKGVIEVVERARDAGIYTAVTDCGAGGLSSAVGEMSAELGVRVDLAGVPLKYAGLAPWEIWLSEAQERMVLAIPAEKVAALAKLCEMYQVEWSDIGQFEASGRLQVLYAGQPVVDIEEEFLHEGHPRLRLVAEVGGAGNQGIGNKELGEGNKGSGNKGLGDSRRLLLALLGHPNIASKEEIIRRYDHEVRGATWVKPMAGEYQDGPSDAAVLKPLEAAGWKGFAVSNGVNPFIGEVDPYLMAYSNVDEAIRNAVAVGADPQRLALLDNFCWGDPRRPETLGSLVRAAQACHDAALYYQAPFISGKDSLNNEYLGSDGQRHAIPGTLLISSIALVPDVRRCVTMDLKTPGSRLYLVGDFNPGLGGSHALMADTAGFLTGLTDADLRTPQLPRQAPEVYQALHRSIQAGKVRSAHDLSEGGLGVAAAEMAMAGRLGLRIDLSGLHADPRLALFGETNGCLLVEVAPEDAQAFEAFFNGTGGATAALPCRPVGGVTPGGFEVAVGEQVIIQISVAELVAAFTQTPSAS